MIEEFSLPTEDGLAQLRGDVMSPDDPTQPTAALLIVPGGWFVDRDGFLGDSYTEADLMYLRIARRVLAERFLVARYDNRGVVGNELTIGLAQESPDPLADTERYFATCVDSEIRRSVTPETLASDAESVYRFLAQHRTVDPSKIVIFAHSEGGLHVARLIGSQRIDPAGVVFAGSIARSPMDGMNWQVVDRYVEEVMRWDRDGDGRVSAGDVASAYGTSYFAEVGVTEEELHPDRGEWSESELRAFFAARYEQTKQRAVEAPDDAPFPDPDDVNLSFVAASNRWWKQWFIDDTPVMEFLRHYPGRVAFHFGEIDRQHSVKREVEYIQECQDSMIHEPKIIVHPSRGHAFGLSKAISGPMDLEAEDIIVEEIAMMLRAG